jgi:hypothetical protein
VIGACPKFGIMHTPRSNMSWPVFSGEHPWCCLMLLILAGRDLIGARRFGPRPLDLDIVFYGNQDVQHEVLSVPHIRCGSSCHVGHTSVFCACRDGGAQTPMQPRSLVQTAAFWHLQVAHCTVRLIAIHAQSMQPPNTSTKHLQCKHQLHVHLQLAGPCICEGPHG